MSLYNDGFYSENCKMFQVEERNNGVILSNIPLMLEIDFEKIGWKKENFVNHCLSFYDYKQEIYNTINGNKYFFRIFDHNRIVERNDDNHSFVTFPYGYTEKDYELLYKCLDPLKKLGWDINIRDGIHVYGNGTTEIMFTPDKNRLKQFSNESIVYNSIEKTIQELGFINIDKVNIYGLSYSLKNIYKKNRNNYYSYENYIEKNGLKPIFYYYFKHLNHTKANDVDNIINNFIELDEKVTYSDIDNNNLIKLLLSNVKKI